MTLIVTDTYALWRLFWPLALKALPCGQLDYGHSPPGAPAVVGLFGAEKSVARNSGSAFVGPGSRTENKFLSGLLLCTGADGLG